MNRPILSIFILTVLAPISVALGSPKVGDKAPPVKVAKWLGTAPASVEAAAQKSWTPTAPPALPGQPGADKHVFVVEFWATWCGPCRRSIPHLGALQEKYKDKGLVIIGVSNEDPETISNWLTKTKTAMPYYVGSDDDMQTNSKWADDIRGIPHAFIVNKTNDVVWTGNPLDQSSFDSTLEKVLAGNFDVQAAKKSAATQEEFNKLMAQLQPAYVAKDDKKLFETLDKMIELKPLELQPYMIKRQMMREFKRQNEIAAFEKKIEEGFQDSSSGLADLVSIQLAEPLGNRNPGLMLRSARRAVELTKSEDATALTNLARVEYEMGMIEQAIQHQTKASSLASKDEAEGAKQTLAYYKAVKELVESDAKSVRANGQ